MNVKTTGMKQRVCSPLTSLDKVEHLDLEVDLGQHVGLGVPLDLILSKDLLYFASLDLLDADVPRCSDKSRLLVGPKIFFDE